MQVQTLLLVGAGGAFGAMGRFLLGRYVLQALGPGFPWGTLAANVIGAFVMGLLVELFATKLSLSTGLQAGLTVGLLGGFTTFSAFSLETALMIERHDWTMALTYVTASVGLCVLALFAALYLVRSWV